MAFCAIPAIDITKGSCVRLKQGLMNDSIVYSKIQFRLLDAGLMKKRREFIWLIRWGFSGNQENTTYRRNT